MTPLQHGRIPCPECAEPLELPVESVLFGRPIPCSSCGLELTADSQASGAALDALSRWYAETKDTHTSVPVSPESDGD